MKWNKLPKEYCDLYKGFPDFAKHGIGIDIMSNNLGNKFIWDNTPQKYNFWHKCLLAETISELPPIPKPCQE